MNLVREEEDSSAWVLGKGVKMSQMAEDALAFLPIAIIIGIIAVCTSGTPSGVLVLLVVGAIVAKAVFSK